MILIKMICEIRAKASIIYIYIIYIYIYYLFRLRNNRIYVPTIANLKAEKIPGNPLLKIPYMGVVWHNYRSKKCRFPMSNENIWIAWRDFT